MSDPHKADVRVDVGGSISIYKERGVWLIDYRDLSGARRRERADTRQVARELLQLRQQQIRDGTFRPSMVADRANLRRSAAMKTKWKTPGYTARLSDAISNALCRPDSRARKAEASRANWKNPKYRQAVPSPAKLAKDPAVNAKRSSSMKRVWAAPGYAEAIGQSMSRVYLTPEYQARNLLGRIQAAQRKGIKLPAATQGKTQVQDAAGKRGPEKYAPEATAWYEVGKAIEERVVAGATVTEARKAEQRRYEYATVVRHHMRYREWLRSSPSTP